MGMIACAASEVSGQTVTNPYKEGSVAAKLWDQGYEAEAEKIREGS